MLTPLKSLLSHVLERKSIERGVRAAVILEAARDVLETLFPKEASAGMVPQSFRDGTLLIGVKHPLLGQEVKLRSEALRHGVNDRFSSPPVLRIRLALIRSRQAEDDMLR
ncbi:DUF721 domain-containing protein [Candidatus Uhrbacteria bacterium]|nr:DUF721 domain-containing protein [Candidatus Uhrbacteria bacterium]